MRNWTPKELDQKLRENPGLSVPLSSGETVRAVIRDVPTEGELLETFAVYKPQNLESVGPYHLTIKGQPVAKARPRVLKNGHTYTPDKTREAELAIAWSFMAAYPGYQVDEEHEFRVRITFSVPSYKNGKQRMFNLDNGCKTVLDALNGIVWLDDNQVTELFATKTQSVTGRTDIKIERLERKK